MKIKSLLLPLLATSFCFGLVGCTDDTSSSNPVVGATSILVINEKNFDKYFEITINKLAVSEEQPNDYSFNVRAKNKNMNRIYVYTETKATINVTCTYKLEPNTNTAHSKSQAVDLTLKNRQDAVKSDNYTITFDQPISEYPYFGTSYRVTSASGKLMKQN